MPSPIGRLFCTGTSGSCSLWRACCRSELFTSCHDILRRCWKHAGFSPWSCICSASTAFFACVFPQRRPADLAKELSETGSARPARHESATIRSRGWRPLCPLRPRSAARPESAFQNREIALSTRSRSSPTRIADSRRRRRRRECGSGRSLRIVNFPARLAASQRYQPLTSHGCTSGQVRHIAICS